MPLWPIPPLFQGDVKPVCYSTATEKLWRLIVENLGEFFPRLTWLLTSPRTVSLPSCQLSPMAAWQGGLQITHSVPDSLSACFQMCYTVRPCNYIWAVAFQWRSKQVVDLKNPKKPAHQGVWLWDKVLRGKNSPWLRRAEEWCELLFSLPLQ